ncbi:hypothetical protein [Croceicoccus bisphenolivorans]|uniref:hypothetical protein n=1 Tax=Croceicoccus bisphenolivorans TaxID=1783232 RepID=UPI000831A5DD|nr:hypothetical protein [Croceicoccus bisphenolivorans]
MSVGGTYEVTTKTPMGDQNGTFSVVPADDGKTFTGAFTGPLGSIDIEDGLIDGNDLTFKVTMTAPMPMTIDGKATVDGEAITGTMTTPFGAMAMTGKRAG